MRFAGDQKTALSGDSLYMILVEKIDLKGMLHIGVISQFLRPSFLLNMMFGIHIKVSGFNSCKIA